MSPVESPHTDMPTATEEMVSRANKTPQKQERGSSNAIDQNNSSYADALWSTNNIGDAWGVNNIRDVCGDTRVLMEID